MQSCETCISQVAIYIAQRRGGTHLFVRTCFVSSPRDIHEAHFMAGVRTSISRSTRVWVTVQFDHDQIGWKGIKAFYKDNGIHVLIFFFFSLQWTTLENQCTASSVAHVKLSSSSCRIITKLSSHCFFIQTAKHNSSDCVSGVFFSFLVYACSWFISNVFVHNGNLSHLATVSIVIVVAKKECFILNAFIDTLVDQQCMACTIVVLIKTSHRYGGELPHDRCRHAGGTFYIPLTCKKE